ncbi:MAG: hypothetical protein QOH06_1278 [Acidobacteriota bacterium]|jgi:hypothetical protein|nr:hypothetical protein [Acidobacteriota bacterium]
MENFAFWMIFPIFGILAGMFKQWLRFRERQNQLGNSTQNLEKLVAEMRQRDQAMAERIENLEAIVVSQTWDVLQDRTLSPADRERRLVAVAQREMPPPPVLDSHKAEVLARRLKA